jgi:hypothetical protein
MKKILVFVLALALALPAVAFAKAEFSLGGFVKLDSFWDSTQQGKNLNGTVLRNNNGNFHHGNLRFTAQATRINFTIKGPKVFGAQTTGFIEMDFDGVNGAVNGNAYTPRLRHAMFRFNWPDTELLFGQYWSLFSSWYSEACNDGVFQISGTPTLRLPQIRLTQKFAGDWKVIGMIAMARSATAPFNAGYSGNSTNGSSAETPMLQAGVIYAHDWWGKAAYHGHPRPFTAQVDFGWQRNIAQTNNAGTALQTIQGQFTNAGVWRNTYQSPWCVMGTLFIPVIPTHTANLANTAHLLAQFWIGQGVNVFGFTGDNVSVFKYNDATSFSPQLLKRWGGFVEGQYYFTNQWFLNVAYSLTKTYNVDQSLITNSFGTFQQYFYNGVNNQFQTQQEVNATLWYRPVQALKFGIQYSFVQSHFWTDTIVGTDATDVGSEHRIEFAGYFFF